MMYVCMYRFMDTMLHKQVFMLVVERTDLTFASIFSAFNQSYVSMLKFK